MANLNKEWWREKPDEQQRQKQLPGFKMSNLGGDFG